MQVLMNKYTPKTTSNFSLQVYKIRIIIYLYDYIVYGV